MNEQELSAQQVVQCVSASVSLTSQVTRTIASIQSACLLLPSSSVRARVYLPSSTV